MKYICSLVIFSICVSSSEPIAYLNTLGYEAAQKETARGNNGMVTTQHFLATGVGEKILNKGGNAYDASIAIAFTLAVVLPRAGNIGGGGFMVMYDSETSKEYSIDYREKAPALSTRDMYLNDDGSLNDKYLSTFGYLSIGVPGTVAGLWEVHKQFGSLPWSALIEDAINYAENGFYMTDYMADVLYKYNEKMSYFPETKKIFQKDYPNFRNKKLFQKDLAKTLRVISLNGRDGFYKGEVAKKITDQMQLNGGLIQSADLENYNPVWREPIISSYRNNKIITMGPPSSGGIHIIQMLNILENYDLNELGHNSTDYINLLTEVMKHAYADRSKYLGDPDFFDVPIDKIISKKYSDEIFNSVALGHSVPAKDIHPGMYLDNESHETTHFSVVDADGNVVSSTYTLNSTFGSGVVIKETGILMNNEMDDFSASPGTPNQFGLLGGEANKIVPEKRPLSSMTPTIILKEGNPYFATGTPGGSRIITSVLQSILNIIDFELEVSDAILKPRIHHQWYPDILQLEKSFNSLHAETLKKKGYEVLMINPATSLQIVMMKNNFYYGFGDTRRPDSLAIGVN